MKISKSCIKFLVIIALVLVCAPISVNAKEDIPTEQWSDHVASTFNSGTGTKDDPYCIATAEELAKLSKDIMENSKQSMYLDTYFRLEADIDLSMYRWNPIGTFQDRTKGNLIIKSFAGNFDGNNKVIKGLIVDERVDGNPAGLFGYVSPLTEKKDIEIKNLTINDAKIYSSEEGLNTAYSGILVGKTIINSGNKIKVTNVNASGSISNNRTSGSYFSGGLIGDAARLEVVDCKVTSISITGSTNTGGFVGGASLSSFKNCTVEGLVSGEWTLGGFVGYSAGDGTGASTFDTCNANVDVIGTNWNLGGFVGMNEYGKFEKCLSEGDVTSDVSRFKPKAGGFAGTNKEGSLDECYSTGIVTGKNPDIAVGGFLGYEDGGKVTNGYFDKEKNPTLLAIGDPSGIAGDTSINDCDTNGIKSEICENLKGGHNISADWTIDTNATCIASGSKYNLCTKCGAHLNITEISSVGHTPLKIEKKAATITENGIIEHWYCSVCDKYFSDEKMENEIERDETIIAKLEETVTVPPTLDIKPTPDTTPTPISPKTSDNLNVFNSLVFMAFSGAMILKGYKGRKEN